MDDDTKVLMPVLGTLMFGRKPIPRPRWMPKFWHNRLKRKQEEDSLMQWKPCPSPEPTGEQLNMLMAQELRDWAERLMGYSHIDPEKSSIPRNKFRVNGNKWLVGHLKASLKTDILKLKKAKPKKEMTERQRRKIVRQSIRETDKKMKEMDIEIA